MKKPQEGEYWRSTISDRIVQVIAVGITQLIYTLEQYGGTYESTMDVHRFINDYEQTDREHWQEWVKQYGFRTTYHPKSEAKGSCVKSQS